jgi:hypothetical protein
MAPECATTIQTSSCPDAPIAARERYVVRRRRLLVLLGFVWLLSVFDLGFTLVARALGVLIELNPLANWLMSEHGDVAVILYKLGLMGTGTIMLWACHSAKLTESAAWFLLIVYALLSVRWYSYYHGEETSQAVIDAVPAIVGSEANAPTTRDARLSPRRTRMADSRSEADDSAIRLAVTPPQ